MTKNEIKTVAEKSSPLFVFTQEVQISIACVEVEIVRVSVKRHHFFLRQNIHSVVQHTFHVFNSLASILCLIRTLK